MQPWRFVRVDAPSTVRRGHPSTLGDTSAKPTAVALGETGLEDVYAAQRSRAFSTAPNCSSRRCPEGRWTKKKPPPKTVVLGFFFWGGPPRGPPPPGRKTPWGGPPGDGILASWPAPSRYVAGRPGPRALVWAGVLAVDAAGAGAAAPHAQRGQPVAVLCLGPVDGFLHAEPMPWSKQGWSHPQALCPENAYLLIMGVCHEGPATQSSAV